MSNTTQALSRIEAILDDSSFVEIGAAVTARATDFNMQEKKAPSDGVITGYGVINGNLVYVYSQDAAAEKRCGCTDFSGFPLGTYQSGFYSHGGKGSAGDRYVCHASYLLS